MGCNAIHNQGIAHRDLKPANIFIKNGEMKIGDFGFSSDNNQLTTQLGTPAYMAPEIMTANPNYTNKVDMWAVGIMYFELLFGTYPFPLKSNMFEHKREVDKFKYRPPRNANVSKESDQVLAGMLKKKVRDRMSAEEVLGSALFAGKGPHPR
jgi:serine/threonine protein kinase